MSAGDTHSLLRRADLKSPDRPVSDVMRTDFRSCNASTPIVDVAGALRASGCSMIAVTEAQVPAGLVTEAELATAVAERGGELTRLTAEDVMDDRKATIAMSAPLHDALERFVEAEGRLMAVNDDGLLKGIVTLSELGPQLTVAGLARLIARLSLHGAIDPGWTRTRTEAEAARAADPTADVDSSKSQAQPHPWDSPTREHTAPIPLVSPSDAVNPLLKVADVMTRAPRTCSPASSAIEAVLIFRDDDCGLVPVTEEGRPIGVVTDRDVALALAGHETDLAATPLERLMTTDLVTIAADASLDEAVASFGDRGLRRLLVVDADGRLVGVLSWSDLAPHLSERGMGRVVSRFVERR
jgi:IMP dehydrogenase